MTRPKVATEFGAWKRRASKSEGATARSRRAAWRRESRDAAAEHMHDALRLEVAIGAELAACASVDHVDRICTQLDRSKR